MLGASSAALPRRVKGAIAGALAGLIASWVMESFQAAWSNATNQIERQKVLTREGAGRRHGARGGPEDPAAQDLPRDDGASRTGIPTPARSEPSTVKVASALAEPILERKLTDEEKPIAGEVVHYGFGSFNGALYGALAEIPLLPIEAFNGTAFGAALWVAADEYVVWKLGIRREEPHFPSMTHAYALASHLVYGLTLETDPPRPLGTCHFGGGRRPAQLIDR